MQSRAILMGDNIFERWGHEAMNVARSGVGLFKSIRGDTGDTVVEGAAPVNYTNMAVYGTLAVLAILIVVKKK